MINLRGEPTVSEQTRGENQVRRSLSDNTGVSVLFFLQLGVTVCCVCVCHSVPCFNKMHEFVGVSESLSAAISICSSVSLCLCAMQT